MGNCREGSSPSFSAIPVNVCQITLKKGARGLRVCAALGFFFGHCQIDFGEEVKVYGDGFGVNLDPVDIGVNDLLEVFQFTG